MLVRGSNGRGRGLRDSATRFTASCCMLEMGNTASVTTAAPASEEKAGQAPAPDMKPKKKICCACPDTKKLRDECIVEHGEDACGKWIEAHRICLRAEGFNV
uniref:Uncharacterized protein n=1 Tax=Avena sativa TaxID=4498 RepID=A0ACD5XLE7_AVESA